ncbi:hypothetical protein SprV_0200914000 [Sparganum proliferum]
MGAYRDERPGIRIAYRTDECLLSIRQMQAPTRLSTTIVYNSLFADGSVLNGSTEKDGQRNIDIFASGCAHFGRTINTDKTVVMHQQSSNAKHGVIRIRVNGTGLKTVSNFNHLDNTMSRPISIDDEVTYRIFKASHFFDRLQNSVWNLHSLQLNTKLRMYKAVPLTTLLYGAGTWTVYYSHGKNSTTSISAAKTEMARQDPRHGSP